MFRAVPFLRAMELGPGDLVHSKTRQQAYFKDVVVSLENGTLLYSNPMTSSDILSEYGVDTNDQSVCMVRNAEAGNTCVHGLFYIVWSEKG